MSIQALTLPLDITWQRFGYSRDMVDTNFRTLSLPPKWRSSMAVYSYVVPDEQTAESYPNARIVYLRLTCSITGFNISEDLVDPDTVGESGDQLDDLQQSAWEAIQSQGWVNRYWPCLGAIAQIAVYPHDTEEVSPDDFPFILDFEPKKRELYETRSDTGEVLSGSSEKINVQKGTTNTESTEESNILTGGGAKFGLGKLEIGANISGEWGTRTKSGEERVNMQTTDTSRERRETTSFNTTYSQMYQLFNGYHLGTNRALFVIAPRPHTVSEPAQVDFNLISGQRKLEGIQDMFLVVQVPKTLKGICVQATLDTGHTVMTADGVILKINDGGLPGDGGRLPPDIDDPFPPVDSLDPGPPTVWSSRLVVTRRTIRSCGLFSESNRLQPTATPELVSESPGITIVHEEAIAAGHPEKSLVKFAPTSKDLKYLVADQRNRFQGRIINSMLSGFSSGRYKPRPITETKVFADLTSLALQQLDIEIGTPAITRALKREDVQYLKRLRVNTVGKLFSVESNKIPAADRVQLDKIRKVIQEHVLQPARKNTY
jgi:hypothetical protein